MSQFRSLQRRPLSAASWRPGAYGLLVGSALGLAACATAPVPTEQMALANSAVDRAADSATEAPAELTQAREKLDRANRALADGDNASARQLAEEAQSAADLAQARARSVRSERALAEVQESIRKLRAQIASE
jgi:Domain of unknown function (DUF4398)